MYTNPFLYIFNNFYENNVIDDPGFSQKKIFKYHTANITVTIKSFQIHGKQ